MSEVMPLAANHYAAEAEYGYKLVAPYLPKRGKILDVGAGLCLLARKLRGEGYDVTALEPCASGFGSFVGALPNAHRDGIPLLEIGVAELNPLKHGTFDFIYSLNVLEHVAGLNAAFSAMAQVLAPGGRMLHYFPNYTVPYENHFGIPLVPFRPQLTAAVLPGSIRESELWRGLNFVTYGKFRRLARECGLTVEFRRGTVFDALVRFEDDPEFASRQSAMRGIYRALKTSGLLRATKCIPARFATPMVAVFTKS